MKKIEIWMIVIVVVLIGITIAARNLNFEDSGNSGIKKVCFEKKCFNVEIADTPLEREKGLMNRDSLEGDSGMLFIFENEGKHSFWMKDTQIALDMIWINSKMEVVDILRADPCVTVECEVYTPRENALYVLEINYGVAENLGIGIGDRVEFS